MTIGTQKQALEELLKQHEVSGQVRQAIYDTTQAIRVDLQQVALRQAEALGAIGEMHKAIEVKLSEHGERLNDHDRLLLVQHGEINRIFGRSAGIAAMSGILVGFFSWVAQWLGIVPPPPHH